MFKVGFLVDDKNLPVVLRACAGKIYDLDVMPVINAEVANGKVKSKGASSLDLFMSEVNKRRLKTLDASTAKEITEAVGLSRTSYGHFLKELVNADRLRKSGDRRNMTYNVVVK